MRGCISGWGAPHARRARGLVRWRGATPIPSPVTSSRSRSTMRGCIRVWGAPHSSWRRSAAWMRRRRRRWRTRSLLIYHSYSGRHRKPEFLRRRAGVDLQIPQYHHPLLTALLDLEPAYQAVRARDPDGGGVVGKGRVARRHRDHVGPPHGTRIGAQPARRVALTGVLDELGQEIRAGVAEFGNRRADHLAGRRAGRVQPQPAPIGNDPITGRVGEPHRELAGALMIQPAGDRIVADGRWL